MGLDYGYTCGDIDDMINYCKSILSDGLSDIISDVCPLLEGEPKESIIITYVDYIYDELESAFEGTRKTNSDLRDVADRQIDSLESMIEDLKDDVETLERELSKHEEV